MFAGPLAERLGAGSSFQKQQLDAMKRANGLLDQIKGAIENAPRLVFG